LDSMIHM